jgi:hypothetical protein
MRFLISAVALGLAWLWPASAEAQSVMQNYSFDQLTDIVDDLGYSIADEDVDDDGDHYLELETDEGLIFYIYGTACDPSDPSKDCRGMNIVATFSLKDGEDPAEVAETISYAFLKVYVDGPDVKVSRYVIFDHGITRENAEANLSIFVDITHDVWDKLSDEGVLE